MKDIAPEKLVYIDESGIELTICKDRGWGKKSKKLIEKEVVNIMSALILSGAW